MREGVCEEHICGKTEPAASDDCDRCYVAEENNDHDKTVEMDV